MQPERREVRGEAPAGGAPAGEAPAPAGEAPAGTAPAGEAPAAPAAAGATARPWPRSGFGLGLHVFIEMAKVVRDGLAAGGEAATPSAMLSDAARRILLTRGQFRRRVKMPLLFPVVATLHILCTTGFLLWPLLFPSRRWDGWWLVLAAAICVHWLLLCGECLLGWLEKALLYEKYRLGEEPMHMWIVDLLPGRAAMALVLLFALACFVASAAMFLRCVRFSLSTVDMHIGFGGLGAFTAAVRWGWTPEEAAPPWAAGHNSAAPGLCPDSSIQ